MQTTHRLRLPALWCLGCAPGCCRRLVGEGAASGSLVTGCPLSVLNRHAGECCAGHACRAVSAHRAVPPAAAEALRSEAA